MAETSTGAADFAQGMPTDASPLSQSNLQNQTAHLNHDQGPNQPGSSTLGDSELRRTNSTASQSHALTPSKGGTLKKRQSLSRRTSLKRSTSNKKSSRPGSVRSLTFADDEGSYNAEINNAFYTPVPTSGNPTEILANRFQVWRKILKDLITYFRDIQKSYETRSKSLYTLSNVVSNISTPPQFMVEGGIGDALHVLRDYHKQSIAESNKAKSIEEDVILQLTGLRSDLGQKIKEIKSLSGDFKNSVDKETESTRRAVRDLQDALGTAGSDSKSDPYLVRLGVDRQVGRQIEEENYLHRAFLNLESSGRELESIVVGEIQKAYNAYAGIIKREGDDAYEAVERLRGGPLAITKDTEWNAFVHDNENFVDPKLPVRKVENINYAGKEDPAATEVKAGMLERKSKYLKSYTPGWYVLSATHLHEFKSPDRISTQTPVMSLPLTDQKLGSHSNPDSTSHKFMLKGRQSGGIHRGHAWVFRAESYDTMMAWFSDIKNLTEKTGEERNAFIRRSHARSLSGSSNKAPSVNSDDRAMEEDEADQVPYSAAASQAEIQAAPDEKLPQRPNPGGRFPSALNINRNSQLPLSPSSPSSSGDREVVAAAGALPGSGVPFGNSGQAVRPGDDETYGGKGEPSGAGSPVAPGTYDPTAPAPAFTRSLPHHVTRHDSTYGEWMAPVAAGAGGAAIGASAAAKREQQLKEAKQETQPGLQAVEVPNTAAQPQIPPLTSTQTLSSGDPYVSPISPAVVSPLPPNTTETITTTSTTTNDSSAAAVAALAATGGIPLSSAASTHPQPHTSTSTGGTADPAAPIKNLAHVTDPASPIRDLANTTPISDTVPTTRPLLESHTSVATISDLDVPGGFPKDTKLGTTGPLPEE